ncbi:39S ribosomal protein L28, mitochondrial [Linnemannia zychae]|nr:39S ribosomal protein L28, mitochondrial [Linnemannia zychae]
MSSPFARTALKANTLMRAAGGAPAGMKKSGGGTSLNGDARNDLIKKVLFDAPPRPPVRMSPEDMTRHETIERAWKLVRQQQKLEQTEGLARKFEMMRKANAELEATSAQLFKHSQTKERHAVFPRQLRTLTDTPPKQIWNYRQTAATPATKA